MHRPLGALSIGEEISVEHVTIPMKHLHPALEGFRVVQLSDLHLYPWTHLEFIQAAVEQANRLKPDLIVLTGDYVSHIAAAVFDLQPVLSQLNATQGVFAVLGNHDHWTDPQVVRTGLRGAGLTVLHNQGVPISVGKGSFYLAGLDDGWVGRADLNVALSNAPDDTPVVLLMHEPDLVDVYSHDKRVTLQLSGHTHGGQVRMQQPRRAYTLPHLGKKYDQGLYRVNDAWLYTNRGIGMVGAPIRMNCPAEVTEFTLTR
jgi:predicted MPP superfamily phosphohydrolase